MKVAWIRGRERISFNRPHSWFILAIRGSGKSSFLEHLGELYLREGHSILDLFGSRDGESLAWLRSPYAQEKRLLLIHSDNTSVEAPCDTKPVSKVRLRDFDDYDILISSSPLYTSPNDEFLQVNKLTDLLYKRLTWKKLVYVLVREASNLYYSRLKVAKNQKTAKSEMVYLIREARHMGVALGLDTLKFTSIDADIRAVIDYLILKKQGLMNLPRELNWIYRYINPTSTRQMKPSNFIMITAGGALGLGAFPNIPWHKQEQEDILRAVNVYVEHGEELQYGQSRGTFKTVSDQEHREIMEAYTANTSMAAIARHKDRSTATIHTQIKKHNQMIQKTNSCPLCKRAGSTLHNKQITK